MRSPRPSKVVVLSHSQPFHTEAPWERLGPSESSTRYPVLGTTPKVRPHRLPGQSERPRERQEGVTVVDSTRPDLLTEQEACAYLNVSRRWLKRARDRGAISFIRLTPITLRYLKSDLDRLISDGTVGGAK